MTTAIETPPVPTQSESPEASLPTMLYGSDPDPATAPPEEVTAPAEPSDQDPSPAAEKAEATSPVEPKPDEPAPGTEAEETPAAKQLAEQRNANKRLGREIADAHQKVADLADELRIWKAKAEGTYEEPVQPTPEQAALEARIKERDRVSREVANETYGADVMEKRVYGKGSEIDTLIAEEMQANPNRLSPTHLAIMLDKQPAIRAIRIVHTNDFRAKYGEDPSKWAEKVIAEAKPKILDELKKQLAAQVVTGTPPRSVTDGRSSGGAPNKKEKTVAQTIFDKTA